MGKTIALIMAAGSGERFEGREPKTLHPLLGRPVIVWAVENFAMNEAIDAVTVVVTPGEETRVRGILDAQPFPPVDHVVPGGDTRQESVRLGLDMLDSSCDTVLVHDAARPCVTPSLIGRMLETVNRNDAVVPVLPAVDTLVREEEGVVDAILDRAGISRVQTPQGFRTGLLAKAHHRARSRGFTSSDDGSLVFALGETVRTIPGEPTNIKITYIEDAKIAESILEKRR
jgi:2-C-methyl-D-erythritol 4-phosphate cytidylyltransferase